MKNYTDKLVQLLINKAVAETRLSIYSQLAQSWDEEFEAYMESKIKKAELKLENIILELEEYEKEHSL